MSFKSILHIDNKEHNVLKWHYSFVQNRDATGRPVGRSLLRRVAITIEATDIIEFLLWANNPTQQKQLMLQIMPRMSGGKSRKINMIDCHCVGYVEEFNANSKTPRTIQLEVTCGGFKEGNSVYVVPWQKTKP